MKKDHLIFIAKLIITTLLVLLLIETIDWRGSLSLIIDISLFYVFLLIVVGLFMIAISALKWQIFLNARGINVPLTHLFLLYLVGYFFNNFLPSNVGGDVARSFALGRQIRNLADSFGSVFLERFTGLLGLLIIAVLVFAFNVRMVGKPELGIFLALFLSSLVTIFFLLFTNGALKLIGVLARYKPMARIQKKFDQFLRAVYFFRNQPVVLSKAMVISFLYHAMTSVNTYVVCLALGLDVSFLDLAVVVPIILVVSMIPISLNSIGVWEGSFVYFFSIIGVPASAALSVALVLRAKNLFFSLVGGGVLGLCSRWFLSMEEGNIIRY